MIVFTPRAMVEETKKIYVYIYIVPKFALYTIIKFEES